MTALDALFSDPEIDPILDELWRVPGWPKDHALDEHLVRELRRQYPNLNLINEIRQMAIWLLSYQPPKGRKVNHRARLGRWCSNALTNRSRSRRPDNRIAAAPAKGPRTGDYHYDFA